MFRAEYYLRVLLAGLWFFFSCFVGIVCCIFKWKNPSMDATFARVLAWGAVPILGLKVRVENQMNLYLHQPCIYVANHQSNIDIITMGCMFPYRTVLIGKKELKKIPLFGFFFYGAGNIMIDRKDVKNSIAGLNVAQAAVIKDGTSIFVFPEGTRNRGADHLLPFKKGAFHMAIAAQVPIVPIVHQHLSRYYDHANKCLHKGEITIKVLTPIPTKGMTAADLETLIGVVRARMEEALATPEMAALACRVRNA